MAEQKNIGNGLMDLVIWISAALAPVIDAVEKLKPEDLTEFIKSLSQPEPAEPYKDLPDPYRGGSYGSHMPGGNVATQDAIKEFAANSAGNHVDSDDEEDDHSWDNHEFVRGNFHNEAGPWHANVSLDEGERDFGVIIDGPHKGKRAHRGNHGLWVVEKPVAAPNILPPNPVDHEPDFALPGTYTDALAIDYATSAASKMSVDQLWHTIFEKFRKLETQQLLSRRDEVVNLFEQMINARQAGAILGSQFYGDWLRHIDSQVQSRLGADLGGINIKPRPIKDQPQA